MEFPFIADTTGFQPYLKESKKLDDLLSRTNEIEKIKCLKSFSIPLSTTNPILSRISIDTIIIIIFTLINVAILTIATVQKVQYSEEEQSGEEYQNLEKAMSYLRLAFGLTALFRVGYEIYMIKVKKIKYSVSSRYITILLNIFIGIFFILYSGYHSK
jgi:hypothetical protein